MKALQANHQSNLKRYRKGQYTCSMRNPNWSLYSNIEVPVQGKRTYEVDFDRLTKAFKRFK
jgi:hypothetical protein